MTKRRREGNNYTAMQNNDLAKMDANERRREKYIGKKENRAKKKIEQIFIFQ
jgi:hypothetical protein